MTRTRPAVRLGPARWIVYGVSVLGIAFLATQLYFFAQIGIWTVVNPVDGVHALRRVALAKTRPDLSICSAPGCRTTRFRAI